MLSCAIRSPIATDMKKEQRRNVMKTNVGGIDRILRILVGLAVIGWGVYANSWLGAIGLIPLVTGLLGWCPLYLPFGLNTKK